LNQRIAILGGGQLGRMLQQASIPYPCELHFLDYGNAPISRISPYLYEGNFRNSEDILRFCKDIQPDTLSIEIEDVAVEALKELEHQGRVKIVPRPYHLSIIKDKGLQKQLYEQLQLPTASFTCYQNKKEIEESLQTGKLEFPFVQKLRKGGYDGKGVQIVFEVLCLL
jgi:5-(carboxyamino)imidazole ribonucleotide synthase